MCVAYPAKILEINGNKATADILGNQVEIDVRLVTPSVGEYVLIHAGCAIEIVRQGQAEELAELYRMIEEASY